MLMLDFKWSEFYKFSLASLALLFSVGTVSHTCHMIFKFKDLRASDKILYIS